jgi:hypothetical protein
MDPREMVIWALAALMWMLVIGFGALLAFGAHEVFKLIKGDK